MKMKLLLIALTALSFFSSKAQNKVEGTGSAAQSVYGEIFGNGLIFSANYDTRFAKKQNGLGMRAGLGFFGGSGGGLLTIPLGLNHLAGKAPNFFESGLGVTILSATGDDVDLFDEGSSAALLVPTVGYRFAPLGKGFTGRIFVGPLVNLGEGGGWIFWGGISAGFKFK